MNEMLYFEYDLAVVNEPKLLAFLFHSDNCSGMYFVNIDSKTACSQHYGQCSNIQDEDSCGRPTFL